ncbi:MAG: hypothetical protein HY541_01230 [Deltaproteobacteria bacterium]|nr:hypothetical protein [Deltaproteobacteria bacterium]
MMSKQGGFYKFLKLLVFFKLLFLLSPCSGDSQFTKKLVASPFIAELYGSATKTIALEADPDSHIAWMGLDQSADWKYFKIDQVTVNGKVTDNETNSSSQIFEDLTFTPSKSSTSGTVSGSDSSFLITMSYKAKVAQEDVDKPFTAYLLIVYDKPKLGTVRIELNGWVRGVCDDCKVAPDYQYVYQAVDHNGDGFPDFDLYVCDGQAVDLAPAEFKSNETLPDDLGTTPADTYAISTITLGDADLFYFYTAEKKPGYVVIDAGDDSLPPSIPLFNLPAVIELPGGIDEIPIELESGTQAICPDSSGLFSCSTDDEDSGIPLIVFDESAGLNVDPLAITNGTVSNPTSNGCPDGFGEWSGIGELGVDITESDVDLKLIATAIVSDEQNSIVQGLDSGIEGALILAVIELTLVEEDSGSL